METTYETSPQQTTVRPSTIRRNLLRARQAVALLGSIATAVQVVIWLMIAILGGGLDAPWWLWSAAFTGLAAGGLTAAHRLVPDAAPRHDANA